MTDGRVRRLGAPLARITLVALVGVAGLFLVYYLTVRTLQGRVFGDASLRGALLTRSALADGADTILDVVSVASLLGAVALVATLALIRLARGPGLAAVGLLVGANVTTMVLKEYVLVRPDVGLSEVSPATLNSLPSGHTTAVFSAFAALLFVVPARWRYPTLVVGLVTATLTAFATMSAGWHRAGDSMAAFLVVATWTAIAAAAVLLIDGREHPRTEVRWPASAKWLAVGSVASFGIGIAMSTALEAMGTIRDATIGSWTAFLVSGLLIIGTGVTALLGMLYVLAETD